MAAPSKMSGKAARVAQRRAAADVLRQAEFWTESVVAEWMALRTAMFAWLEARGVAYEGTRDAIVATMSLLGSIETATDIIFIYHVATLAEWDEDFAVTDQQASLVQQISERVRESMIVTLAGGD